ncbi:patatin-like phospholipase family protein [Neobacillus sp. YIM B06451]|uniref:patatin-like phospholipase family protein n=1 Tax=Neobacillus sp. YIM B06451 TaxID=3070994 RepID=UPI00292FD8B2|nr:patatin-like phospholipase family protein [Neobacillus sp. YIM B06451]
MLIDGVFSGGGIKGFALVGAYEAIERRGFRFCRVAGTSAGSIVASLISAGYTSGEMRGLLDELDLSDLLDSRKLLIPGPVTKWILLYWKLGLYKGEALEQWLAEKLAIKGLRTFADLPHQALRVVASDLTNGKMIILPDDLPKYGIAPEAFPVAKAVRMSCSIPYFFEPVKLAGLGGKNIVVDGGVLSNFPMWLFDTENVKKVRPVLGIQLSHEPENHPKHKIKNAIHLFEALFETMKDAHDARYISRKHAKNIIFIPTAGVASTEFGLTAEKKEKLISHGRLCAENFFKKWSY